MTERPIPLDIKKQLSKWNVCFWIWNGIHYALGLYATVGAVVVASKKFPDDDWISISVAIATAALTFLKAPAKAKAYIAAWRLLHSECISFKQDPEYTGAKLADVHKKGEAIIGEAD